MLTPEEVSLIIQTARSPRDKALLAMLYDGSNRPIELLRLKWSDIHYDEFGAYFITDAKTNKERRIRLTNISLGYLEQWKKKHPDPILDQYVFCTINESKEGKGIRPFLSIIYRDWSESSKEIRDYKIKTVNIQADKDNPRRKRWI